MNQLKKNVLFVIKTVMVFQNVIKNNAMKNIKDTNQRSRTPQQSFAQYFRSKPSNLPPGNMVQSVAPPLQYMPTQQDTFINTSASIPEPMKAFHSLDQSYTPEEYLQKVEAILTFSIGEEPQYNPVKYSS